MTPLLLVPAIILAPLATAQNAVDRQTSSVQVPTPTTQAALASSVTVIFTSVASSPLSDVPGIPGIKFSNFDRPNLSPNGLNYVITAITDQASSESDLLIVNGAVVLRETEAPSFLEPGNTLGNFDQGASINDSGQVAFNVDTTAASTEDDFVMFYDGVDSFTVVARENSPIVGGPAGWIYDNLSTAVITDAGVVGYEADQIDGTAGGTSDDNALFFGPTPFLQKGVDIPTGQLGGAMEFWGDFDFEDLYINATGSRYIVQGDHGGNIGNDDMVVVDGVVVVQEGFALPGGDPMDIVDSGGIAAVYMSGGGDWTAEGDFEANDNDEDWVIYNGDLVARENNPIHVGAMENWGAAAFFASTCNGVGDYLVGGFSDVSDTMLNGVVVLNGERIVVREGDPIDLDGNGLFDDGLFLNAFSTDDFRLTDDLQLYFVASLREAGSVATVGNIFCKVDLRDAVGTTLCAGQPNSTGGESRLGASGSNLAMDNSLTVVVEGLPSGVTGFFVTSLETILVTNPAGGAGDLCIGSTVMGRYSNTLQTASAMGSVSQALDLTMIPIPTGFTTIASGETRYWQFWHRDTVGGMATSNFSSALCVTFE